MALISRRRCFSMLVVIAGLAAQPAVHAAAALDPSFGNGGNSILSFPGLATPGASGAGVVAAAIQGGDKVVILGSSPEAFDSSGALTGKSWVLMRLDDSGALDSSFGQGGMVVTRPRPVSTATAMAVDAQGRIVVVGLAGEALVLARYLRDGGLDPAFGQGGVAEAAVARFPPVGVALQPDGKIVVLFDTTIFHGFVLGPEFGMTLQRFDDRGYPDASFASVAGCRSAPVSVSILAGGKFLVTGTGQGLAYPADGPCAARIDAQGALDKSFGTQGIFKAPGDGWSDVIVESRGSFLAGNDRPLPGTGTLQRFLSGGTADVTFNSGGSVSADAERLALGCNGTFLMASGRGGYLRLSRKFSDGSPDTSFGSAGSDQLTASIPGRSDIQANITKLLLQRDGKIVVVSRAGSGIDPLQVVVQRFTQDSCEVPAAASKADVIEFYNANLDHYFYTAFADEAGALESLYGGAWKRTGVTFKAFSAPDAVNASLSPLCRFYGSPAGPNTHFYTARTDECAYLRAVQAATPATSPRFDFEGNAFWVSLPLGGACVPSAPVEVIRVYNNGYARGTDPNLRYTTDPQIVSTMVGRGWISEGLALCTRN